MMGLKHWKLNLRPVIGMVGLLACTVLGPQISRGSDRAYTVDTAVSGATAETGEKPAGQAKGSVRVLRSPEFEVGPDEPELQPKQQVVTQVSRPKVVRQLKFQRLHVNGFPVEPRVKFSRDTEVFETDRIVDEEIRADFFEKVAADLAP